jgi:hypothetical protein
MLDRAPPIDDAVEPLCRSDVMRVISIAAVCAARRAIDRERHAHAIAQAGRDYPSIPLLLRDPKASLDVDYSRQLVNIAVAFVETLTRLSAAAEMMDRGTYVPLGRYDAKPGPVHIVGKTALWVHELSFPITVTRALVEQRDYVWIARLLLETASFELDKAMLSAKGGDVRGLRGLLYKVVPAWPRVASDAMTRDLDGLIAKLGRHGAPGRHVLFIGAPPQVDAINRRPMKSILHRVRQSAALSKGTLIAVADHAVVSAIGEPRITAAKIGLEKVEIKLHLPLAWCLRSQDMIAWTHGVEWGETPKKAEPEVKPWPGLTEGQAREVAREFCATLMRTDGREADKRLDAHLRYYGCPQDQLEVWRAHIKAVPLSTLMENGDA